MGFLIAFIQMMMGRFTYVIPKMNEFAADTRSAWVSLSRLKEYLSLEDEITAPRSTEIRREDAQGSLRPVLEFRQLSFAYPGSDVVLKDISFSLEQGEHLAIVGGSGSGKSTILKLIMGLYRKPSSYQGEIYLLGRELKDWSGKNLRELVAPVFQENYFFQGTISSNLTPLDLLRHDLENAAKLRHLIESMDLPSDILDRQILSGGKELSGGEAQRLAVLRALLKGADLILLDEPSSALDSVSSKALHSLLERILQTETVVQVSHELRYITGYDQILFLENGRIIERGKHEDLMKLNGSYASMYRKQNEEVTDEEA